MLWRERSCPKGGTIEPCLPSLAKKPPAGPDWIHEIKQDGFRIMARRDSVALSAAIKRINKMKRASKTHS